ncbi:MAG: thioredoxin domain-containing protein [Phycisphaeraceae bacterium]
MLLSKRIAIGFVVVMALAAIAVPPVTRAQETAPKEGPKVVGLLFYADWCASCKALEPKLKEVKKQVMDQPIYFTRVDMTDDCTKKQSGMFAEWVGLGEIYREHAPKTGFMLLIDAKEKKVLDKLTKTQSEAELKAAIEQAIAKAK